ncbi:MAG: BolA family protein [Alphaproteobacteria bacterium]
MSIPRKQVIFDLLEKAYSPQELAVEDESHLHAGHAGAPEGGESHFKVSIKAMAFEGKTRLESHRMIYDTLKTVSYHALKIRCSG